MRLQSFVARLQEQLETGKEENIELCKNSRAALVVRQTYALRVNTDANNISEMYSLDTAKTIQLPENTTIRNAEVTKISGGRVYFALNLFTPEEECVLREHNLDKLDVLVELNGSEEVLMANTKDSYFVPDSLEVGVEYTAKIKLDMA